MIIVVCILAFISAPFFLIWRDRSSDETAYLAFTKRMPVGKDMWEKILEAARKNNYYGNAFDVVDKLTKLNYRLNTSQLASLGYGWAESGECEFRFADRLERNQRIKIMDEKLTTILTGLK